MNLPSSRTLPQLLLIVLTLALARAATDPAVKDAATLFINTREALWFKHKSPAIYEAYPFGESNAAHNRELDKVFNFSAVSKDTSLRNKRFLAEGDWYAVEWHYAATHVATGRRQKEGSLCIAQVKDQQLVQWIEYFDDTVGELQIAGKLPLPPDVEEPFPWPLEAKLKRPYRP